MRFIVGMVAAADMRLQAEGFRRAVIPEQGVQYPVIGQLRVVFQIVFRGRCHTWRRLVLFWNIDVRGL
jgi:hypothetical protein